MSKDTEKWTGRTILAAGILFVLLAGSVLAAVYWNRSAPKPKRVFKSAEPLGETSPLAIVKGVAYFTDNDKCYAVDLQTGRLKWAQEVKTAAYLPKPLVTDKFVCLEDCNQYLCALDISNGKIRWKRENHISGLPWVDGPMTLSCEKGVFYTIIWDFDTKGPDEQFTYIVGLDIRTGEEVWRLKLMKNQHYLHVPTVADGIAYFGTFYCDQEDYENRHIQFHAVDIQSNSSRWKVDTSRRYGHILPPVVGKEITIFTICNGGRAVLYAHRTSDGAELWEFETIFVWKYLPTISDGKVFVYSGFGHLDALDAQTGKVVWKTESSRYIQSSPIVADGKVVHATEDDYLRVLKADTGELLWKVHIADVKFSRITVAEGKIFIKDEEGILTVPLQ